MEIHVLKAQALSERQIARKLRISRNTVARYLEAPEALGYKMRQPRPTKLEPFKAYIKKRIAEVRPDWIPAPAMLRELRAQGYTGQVRQLQEFMRSCKPAPKDDLVVRFETVPGQQMQCDFVAFRHRRDPLYAFTATLGHSRWRWVRFTCDETAATLVACHHALFAALGGVPQEILYDNAKSVVTKRDGYGEGQHRWNDDFPDMAKRHGFLPRLCCPYYARTKGKVEPYHRYLRGNFYVPLESWMRVSGLNVDVATANAEVGKWLRDVGNRSVHPQTGHAPHTLYENVEKARLQPLPKHAPRLQPARPTMRAISEQVHSLQHPLSVFLLTAKRDTAAAQRFLAKAMAQHGQPDSITIDKSGANRAAIQKYNAEQENTVVIRQNKYLNNLVEQDHRAQAYYSSQLGFKSFRCARILLAEIELMHMIRKGQMRDTPNRNPSPATQFYALAA